MPSTTPRPPTAAEAAVCAEEERLAAAVREAVRAAHARLAPGDTGAATLTALRDDYTAARDEDKPPLLAQMLQASAREDARRDAGFPDLGDPYFAHMRVHTAGRVRDVLLGPRAFVDAPSGVAIIDYRRAPLAEVFFTCEPGDDYEIAVDGRTLTGTLEARRLVTFERGEPAAVTTPGGALVRADGAWRFEAGALVPTLVRAPGQPLAAELFGHGQGGPRIAALLDEAQTALLRRDPGEPLLVLGAAGCGKTTVALHRAAALCRADPARFPAERTLVVVPEPGLCRLAERMLGDLDVADVPVRTFDDWIRAEARRVFPWLPARIAPEAPLAVRRLKRHPAVFAAIDALIDDLAATIANRLDRALGCGGDVVRAVAARVEPILADRLRAAEAELATDASPDLRRRMEDAFRDERDGLERVRGSLRRLVGDRELLAHATRAAGVDLPKSVVEQAADHTRRQLDEPSEERFADIAAGRREAVDGRSLDEGTPDETAGTFDVEDHALLFELLYRKTGQIGTHAGALAKIAHLVIDEAQELAPIELRVLGRALEGSSVTVAGDAAQRIDRSGHFASWDAVIAALDVRAEPAHLETSYRCPEPIVALTHAILGADAPPVTPHAARSGPPVLRTALPGEGHTAVVITEALRDLTGRERRASIAVIAADAKTARAIHDVVARALPARLVTDGDFSFGPGVEITEVSEVKGLEFDFVVVPDADARTYPDSPEHRRTLHVALTRAAHQAWVICPGVASPILP